MGIILNNRHFVRNITIVKLIVNGYIFRVKLPTTSGEWVEQGCSKSEWYRKTNNIYGSEQRFLFPILTSLTLI